MIIVCGTGHGGTRLPVWLLKNAGATITECTSPGTHDCKTLMNFFATNTTRYVAGYDPKEEDWQEKWKDIKNADIIKDTRSSLWLPWLDERIPNMKVIHMVRDGRDYVDRQLNGKERKNFDGVGILTKAERELPLREMMMAWWRELHTKAVAFDQDRYLRVRLEDLVTDTEEWTKKILDFAEVEANWQAVSSFIEVPESIGVYKKTFTAEQIEKLTEIGQPLMRDWGYDTR